MMMLLAAVDGVLFLHESSSSSTPLMEMPKQANFLPLTALISFVGLATSLRLIMFDLPSPVMRGESVELSCIYDLENDKLYSVKWYKNNVEFYRFIPRDWPPGQFLPHKGIRVDLSRSGKDSVYLKDVDLNSTGVYRCEVSAEAPTFNTAEMEKEMIVYVQPSEGPRITGAKTQLKLGETVHLSCSSAKSKPAASLRWHINDYDQIESDMHVSHATVLHEDGLESSTLGLKFVAQKAHFKNGFIRIKCTATISPRPYDMSSEIILRADSLVHQSSRLHLRKNFSQGFEGIYQSLLKFSNVHGNGDSLDRNNRFSGENLLPEGFPSYPILQSFCSHGHGKKFCPLDFDEFQNRRETAGENMAPNDFMINQPKEPAATPHVTRAEDAEKRMTDEDQHPSPLASPIESPIKQSDVDAQRRRSSLVLADSEVINITKKGRSGSRSPRRGSHAYLMGDDTILVQFENGKRRLSSFCASSNDETMITIDDALTEEEVVETLKAHKQIIANIKTQSWPMHRKLKILRRAKLYIKKHEGDLKQSKQAKDIVAKYTTYLEKTINRMKREINNLVVQLTPWEMRIKKIESQFGSVVASYFTFLRWVFWINTFVSILICIFIMVPEILRGGKDPTQMRRYESFDKNITFREMINTVWNFELGFLKYSPFFYGYYSNEEQTSIGYRLPLAYFGTSMCLYAFSFFCILRKMATNARTSRVGSKDDEYVFTWKLFTGWDFMIGNSETAYNKVASIVMGFKEVIVEEKEKKKVDKDWKVLLKRVIANILVLMLLVSSAYAVVLVVQRSLKVPDDAGWIRKNEVQFVMSGISNFFPNIFSVIAHLEDYHPRIALRWQLGRILILYLLNQYTFLLSTFVKIDDMTTKLLSFKRNVSLIHETTVSGLSTESDPVKLRVLLWLPEELEQRNKRSEGRLFPPEEMLANPRGDQDFQMTTGLATFDPYSRNDLDEEEPLDGRYFSKLKPRPQTTSNTETLKITNTKLPSSPKTEFFETKTEKTTPKFSTPPVTFIAIRTTNYSSIESDTSPFTSQSTTAQMKTTSVSPNFNKTLLNITSTTKLSTTLSSGDSSQASGSSMPSILSSNDSENFNSSTEYQPSSATITLPVSQTVPACQDMTTIFTYSADDLYQLTETELISLRELCWETMLGQEIAKMLVMDLIFFIGSVICFDFGRALIVRYCNDCSCIFWDLEKSFPGYGDFQIAENILHLVHNQGNMWLGMFFSPGVPAFNTIKLCIIMYLRSWAVLTSNIPHEIVFKASGSNNFYYALLLLMLFINTLPVGYAVVWLEPSWHCGPFSGYDRIYKVFTKYLEDSLPKKINAIIDYLSSPGTVIPVLMLLILIIYYLMSTVSSLRETNTELKNVLRKEKDTLDDGKADEDRINPIADEILTPGIEKKHVRISDDIDDSDKAKLIPNL